MRIANTLNESLGHSQAVGLHRAEIGHAPSPEGRGEAECTRRYFTKVVHTTEVRCEIRRERYMVEVAAELHYVRAARPQEIVGELITLFCAPYEAVRFPPDKRKSRNVDCHVAAGRI